jgi:hypothetical protein
MPTEQILTLLIQERDKLNRTIEALRRALEAQWPAAKESRRSHRSCGSDQVAKPHTSAAESAGEANEGILGETQEGSDEIDLHRVEDG